MPANTRTSPDKTFSVTAHVGDCKTMLAFNLEPARTAGLAGFTIQCQPQGKAAYFLLNTLQFEHPEQHAQVAGEPAHSSANAPFHKFRWLHVPGSAHQGTQPFFGPYTYTVTPRYLDGQGRLRPLDGALGVAVTVNVGPFVKNGLKLGFTRGYTQSEAFVRHFGTKALMQPKNRALLFDTAQQAGAGPDGKPFSFADIYAWAGLTARQRVLEFLQEVLADKDQLLDVFAYDLNEPDVCKLLLKLAAQGRCRMVLDNAALHHNAAKPTLEDQFEAEFNRVGKSPSALLRGHFGRYAHDKVFVSFNRQQALKVLTGSTNFSATGMYVNSNHVLVYEDSAVAAQYGALFEAVWAGKAKLPAYLATGFAAQNYQAPAGLPPTRISFAPHAQAFAQQTLDGIAQRVAAEGGKGKTVGSVLFAVMEVDNGNSPVYEALKTLHEDERVFSYGISDSGKNVTLYEPGRPHGVLVTGKPGSTLLPPPFDQIPNKIGLGHQIHHKFVVCGFNTADAVVYCGSSNLALGGEQANGDNLLAIRDRDVATVFAIEALGLVDHFLFLDRMAEKTQVAQGQVKTPASKQKAAQSAGWFLPTSDGWVKPYYDPQDLRCVDRKLFA